MNTRLNKSFQRICLSLLALMFAGVVSAQQVSKEEAMQKAQAFLSKLQKAAPQGMRLAAKSSQLTPSETAENYYVFNVGQANGYVIVSADDRTAAILGYADEGTFDKDNMPENMKAWLQGYADQLDYLAIHPEAEIARVQLDEHAAVVPLLTSSWDQGEPYNRLCPKDGTTNSVTGCVATAMAQVLYYYKYPEKTLKKIRKEAAQRGGCIVLILSQQSQSGGFFQDGHASMTGEVYTY
jgi:hypothetical protein